MKSLMWRDKIQLVLLSGVIFDLGCMPVLATTYNTQLNFTLPAILNGGDAVIYKVPTNVSNFIGIKTVAASSISVNDIGQGDGVDVQIISGGRVVGVQLNSPNSVNDLGQESKITVEGSIPIDSNEVDTVSGIEVLGSKETLTADTLKVVVKNNDNKGGAVGIKVQNGGTVTLKNQNTIEVTAGDGAAINTMLGSSAALKAAAQKNTTTALNNTIKVDQVTITAHNAVGAYADANGKIDLGQYSSITTTGNEAVGILAKSIGANIQAKNISVKTIGSDSSGIYSTGGGDIDIAEGSSVETTDSIGLFINDSDTTGTRKSTLDYIGTDTSRNKLVIETTSPGLVAAFSQGASADLTIDKTDIVAKGADAVRADSSGTIKLKNSTVSIIPNLPTDTIFAVRSTNAGKINLSGNTTILAHEGVGSALFADKATINIQGKLDITGNIDASGTGSLITMDASTGSVFKGNSLIESGGTTNISMTDSSWNMTDNSEVTNLTLINGSKISFDKASSSTLTSNTLAGYGLFNMKADLVNQQGDLIVINGAVTGNHKIKIANDASAATDGTETLTIVKTGTVNNPTNNFSLVSNVEQGAYEYGLRSVAGAPYNLQLYSLGRKLSSTALAAGSFLNIAYLTNYVENQTLLQRLGDLRNNENGTATQNGFWMKGFGGKLNSFSGNALKGFDMAYTGTQFGIDKSYDVDSGRLVVGVMAGFTRTNPNYHHGDGNGKNYTAGLYTTFLMDSGVYVDNVLKFNRMRNHFSVKDTAGIAVKGTGKTNGVSFSTEVGKRFWLTGHKQGFYLEPQAQLSYGYQTGDTVKASNGLKVGLSHYNSTLGRISGIVGYQVQGNTPINIYLKTGVVREMSGGANYRFNDGDKNGHSFRSNWFDNGIGVDININKKHNIYAEADYATGNQFDNAKLNIGYRYSF